MPFKPGQPRPPGAGRKKGSHNKLTQKAIDLLASLGCDPIKGMAKIAMNPKNPIELRGRMYAELAQYAHPKLKAIEHSGPGGGAIPIKRIIGVSEDDI